MEYKYDDNTKFIREIIRYHGGFKDVFDVEKPEFNHALQSAFRGWIFMDKTIYSVRPTLLTPCINNFQGLTLEEYIDGYFGIRINDFEATFANQFLKKWYDIGQITEIFHRYMIKELKKINPKLATQYVQDLVAFNDKLINAKIEELELKKEDLIAAKSAFKAKYDRILSTPTRKPRS